MSRPPRILLFAAIAIAGLAVLVAAGLLFFVDANHHRARLEAAVSKTLGMELTVAGPMGITVFPGLLVTLADVQVRSGGRDVVSAKEARLGIALLPLLTGDVRITSLR